MAVLRRQLQIVVIIIIIITLQNLSKIYFAYRSAICNGTAEIYKTEPQRLNKR